MTRSAYFNTSQISFYPKMALVSRYMGSCVITLIRYVGVVEHSLYGGGPPAAEIITERISTSDPLKLQNR